jgi:hypothetical protein
MQRQSQSRTRAAERLRQLPYHRWRRRAGERRRLANALFVCGCMPTYCSCNIGTSTSGTPYYCRPGELLVPKIDGFESGAKARAKSRPALSSLKRTTATHMPCARSKTRTEWSPCVLASSVMSWLHESAIVERGPSRAAGSRSSAARRACSTRRRPTRRCARTRGAPAAARARGGATRGWRAGGPSRPSLGLAPRSPRAGDLGSGREAEW